jgi:hypothetical protein
MMQTALAILVLVFGTTGFEGSWANGTFFTYMNGKNGAGLRRIAGSAYGDGSEYPVNVRMDGNPWTTLCPAPVAIGAWTPAQTIGNHAGWGCLMLDTYMSDVNSASQAVVGDRISNVRWVPLGAGKRAVGFHYDKSSGGVIWLNVHTRDCLSDGAGGGRGVDYNRICPSGENDDDWVF